MSIPTDVTGWTHERFAKAVADVTTLELIRARVNARIDEVIVARGDARNLARVRGLGRFLDVEIARRQTARTRLNRYDYEVMLDGSWRLG